MLRRTTVPLSKALPLTRRIPFARTSYIPIAKRTFHYSPNPKADSKATYATVVMEKHPPATPNVFPITAKDEKIVAKVDPKP